MLTRRLLSVLIILLFGCNDDEGQDCDLPIAAYCDETQSCDQQGDFERALDGALSGEHMGFDASHIRVCSDRVIVQFGRGYGGSVNTYDGETGELTSAYSFSDTVVKGRCSSKRYGEPDLEAACEDACLLFGAPFLQEDDDDPLCEGAIAEPVIALCQTIAAEAYEPACAECACTECYAQVVSPLSGELTADGTIIPQGCLAEHCPEACAD
jgi:hypothetical protein